MKDSFREWNLYHKSVAAFVAAIGFGVVLRALLVIDTAFEVKDERIFNATANSIWDLVVTDEERDKWQAELIDLVELTGHTFEPSATRLLFWKNGLKRWQAVERTRNVLPGRILELEQSADQDTRWVTISLEVIAPCQMKLSIVEIIEPTKYLDRFWFFNERSRHEKRLAASLDAMDRWSTITSPDCKNL